MPLVQRRFEQFGFPLVVDRTIIPKDDDSTLFVCSGMQQVKRKFHDSEGDRHGSLQSCIRTDDIDLVGDGSNLTYFEMLGNFSFGGNDYATSCFRSFSGRRKVRQQGPLSVEYSDKCLASRPGPQCIVFGFQNMFILECAFAVHPRSVSSKSRDLLKMVPLRLHQDSPTSEKRGG